MSQDPQNKDITSTVPVRRGKVESVDLYEVKERELEILENGVTNGQSSLFLNFAIFLISIAVSCTLTLATTSTYKYQITQTLILLLVIVGYLLGAFLLLLWFRFHQNEKTSVKETIMTIKSRIGDCHVASIQTSETTTITFTEDKNAPTPPVK